MRFEVLLRRVCKMVVSSCKLLPIFVGKRCEKCEGRDPCAGNVCVLARITHAGLLFVVKVPQPSSTITQLKALPFHPGVWVQSLPRATPPFLSSAKGKR